MARGRAYSCSPTFASVGSRLALALLTATGSCSDGTAPVRASVPAAMLIVSGDGLTGTVGAELAQPLVARVVDAQNQPVAGQLVNFRVVSGGGSVFAGSALTSRDGLAQERWTLGTSTADSQKVEARAVDNVTGTPLVLATFRAIGTPGVPASLTVVSGAEQTVSAGAAALPDSLLVRVADRYGNAVPGVTVTWTVPADAGTLSRTSDVTSATGHASTRLTPGTRPGAYSVVAATSGSTAAFNVVLKPAAPAALAIHAGDAQTGTVGEPVPVELAVRVLDSYGNPVGGANVRFLPGANGSVPTSSPVPTSDSGIARVRWTLAPKAGSQTLQAVVEGLTPVTFSATAIAGPAAHVVKLGGDAQTAGIASAVTVPPSVRLTDAHDNPIAGSEVRFAVTSGGGSATGAVAITDAAGIATVGSWVLGPTKGPNSLQATSGTLPPVTFTATAGERSPDIGVTLVRPTPTGTITGDTLLVRVSVASRFSLASVHAAIGANDVSLTFSPSTGRWEGTLSLASEARGPLQLVVTARDVNGGTTDAFATIEHDRAPTLAITSPLEGTVVRSTLDLSATCADDDPAGCQSVTVSANGIVLASGTSALSGSASLASLDGRLVPLTFVGVDSRGRSTSVTRNVYVVSSASLTEIVSGTGNALDLRGDRVLFLDGARSATIVRAGSGATEIIGVSTGATVVDGFVTPFGAILSLSLPSYPYGAVADWRNGAMVDLGPLNSVSSLRVAGDYAIYSTGDGGYNSLVRRDLQAGTNVVAAGAGNIMNDVAANGDVAFWTSAHAVFRYRAGVSTPLTSDDPSLLWNDWVVTDGVNVVYRKHTACCASQSYQIALHDGVSETILAPARTLEVVPQNDFAVNGGWTAFAMADAGGALQIWTRSPTGTLTRVTSFGSNSRVVAIGTDGSVIFSNGGRRYRARAGGTVQDVMPDLGEVLWRDGRFVVLIGRTAFELAP